MKSLVLSAILTVTSTQPHHPAPIAEDAPLEQVDGGCSELPQHKAWKPKAEPKTPDSQATLADWVTAIAAVASVIIATITLYIDIKKR